VEVALVVGSILCIAVITNLHHGAGRIEHAARNWSGWARTLLIGGSLKGALEGAPSARAYCVDSSASERSRADLGLARVVP